eukprot:6870796-Alexandrium_andersonii.AAC.1
MFLICVALPSLGIASLMFVIGLVFSKSSEMGIIGIGSGQVNSGADALRCQATMYKRGRCCGTPPTSDESRTVHFT